MKKKSIMTKQTTKRVVAGTLCAVLAAGVFGNIGITTAGAQTTPATVTQTQTNASGNAVVNNISKEVEIKVTNLYCDSSVDVVAGKSASFETLWIPENAFNPQIVYSIENPSIATVDAATGLVTGIKPGITYVNVKSVNSDTDVSARVKVVVKVPQVTKFKKKKVTSNSVTLQWKKNKFAKKYEIKAYVYNGKKKKTAFTKTVKKNKVVIKNLSSKKKYTFKIRAVRKGQPGTRYSMYTNEIKVKTK